MADVLWDKQTLTPFCPGGKDLVVSRQSLQWISGAVVSFCILVKLKSAKNGLVSGLWSSPLPQTTDMGKPVMSFRLPQKLFGPSWWRASAMKNYGISELRQWCEQLTAADTGVLGWSLLVKAEVLQEEFAMCCGEGAASQQGLDVELSRVAVFADAFTFIAFRKMGLGWQFSFLFLGVSKQYYVKIMPRVQLIYAARFLC